MKKNLTELVFIIDRSGSMSGFEDDTIGGFNSTIEKQKNDEGECLVSTVLFNSHVKVLHDRSPISKIKPMTIDDYGVYGGTALLDAVGGAIHHIGNIHKYSRDEDVPEHTIFVITTDGKENSSRCYTKDQIKELIKRQTEKYGWEFIFLAANIDAIEAASDIGIRRERAAGYRQSKDGYEAYYSSINKFVTMNRRYRSAEEIDREWKKDLDNEV